MTSADLIEEVRIEMDNIEVVLKELTDLYKDVKGKEISTRNKTAAAAFLAQFYSGIEDFFKTLK